MSDSFTLEPMNVALPRGAFTGGGRDILRHLSVPICAFTRGALRPCLHPVWTPAGHVVTAEQPADHPHHRGIWIASDHVGLLVQGPNGAERYDYNFYVDEVFQGRAPGRITQTALCLAAQTDKRVLVQQELDWIGPAEWGARDGRRVLRETRWTAISLTDRAFIFDISSEVSPAGDDPVMIGPTRHAWFNARLADAIALDASSAPIDDKGRRDADVIGQSAPDWVDYSGSVGAGHRAGITAKPTHAEATAWFVADWGVITVGSMRDDGVSLSPDSSVRLTCRFIAHDGLDPDINDWVAAPFVSPESIAETGDQR